MSRRRKIFLGVLTAWPLVYIVLFMIGMAAMFAGVPMMAEAGQDSAAGGLFMGGFGLMFVGHFVTMFVQMGLLCFFLYHVFKRKDLETNTQLLWALLIFMGGPIGQLVYWWKEIWQEDEQPQPAAAGPRPNVSTTSQPGGHDGRV
jgi:hypothetical protein